MSKVSFGRVALATVLGAMALWAGYFISVDRSDIPISRSRSPMASSQDYNGTEVVLLLFGASHCAASQHERLSADFSVIEKHSRREADAEGKLFRTIGVALDVGAEAGVEFLNKFGQFDLIVAGGGWNNLASRQYMWQRFKGPAVTPQAVLVERSVMGPSMDQPTARFQVLKERVIWRGSGLDDIRRYAASLQRDR